MSVILTKELKLDNQAIEVVVKYDVSTNTVGDIKSIWLINNGKQIPIGNLMMKYFEPAINKIIDETDWREEYRKMGESEDMAHVEIMTDTFAKIASYFQPVK